MANRIKIQQRFHLVSRVLVAFVLMVTLGLAVEITPVGSLEDELFAPTSIAVQADELAVLEPFARQLKIFSADGVLTHRVEIAGDVSGLTRLSTEEYLYCDRERQKVITVNITNGTQHDLTTNAPLPATPTDLILTGAVLHILDGFSGAITRINVSDGSWREIALKDSAKTSDQFFTSFAYDESREQYYLLDQLSSEIVVLDGTGQVNNSFGGFGNDAGQITRGGEVALDKYGRLYVTDRFQGTVTLFSTDGRHLGGVNPFDGMVAVPTGIAVDNDGVMYVASTMGRGIRMFFVTAAPTLDEAVSIVDRFPAEGAVIDPSEVWFATEVRPGEAAGAIRGIDFGLFADSLDLPLEITENVTPETTTSTDGQDILISARWLPEYRFGPGNAFVWRTRVRSDTEIGQWSDFRSFRTQALPLDYRLDQNYPNPFNPSTLISFSLPQEIEARVEVFNLLGQRVTTLVNELMPAGSHTVEWQGADESGDAVATGVYFYRLSTDDYSQTRKMVLIR